MGRFARRRSLETQSAALQRGAQRRCGPEAEGRRPASLYINTLAFFLLGIGGEKVVAKTTGPISMKFGT